MRAHTYTHLQVHRAWQCGSDELVERDDAFPQDAHLTNQRVHLCTVVKGPHNT